MVTFTKNGRDVEASELLKMETARARRMMALLMQKLGPQGMIDLFADEMAEQARHEHTWHERSQGKFRGSIVRARVEQGNAAEFLDWFLTGYNGPNAPAMLRAHPEHLGALAFPDGRVGILEVTAHGERPAKLYLRVLEDWTGCPIELDAAMPHRMMGRVETAEGELIGYLLHELADLNPGFAVKLGIYWPAAAPDDHIDGHVDHLMVEFNNWFQMYLLTRTQPADLMPVALTCGL